MICNLIRQALDVASIIRDFNKPDIFELGWIHNNKAQELQGEGS